MSLRIRLSLFVLLALAALAGAGCGSSSTGTTVDPANAVPATAALYAGAVVRPEGALQKAAQAAGSTLTHQSDPYLRLLGALQTPGSPRPDFKRDIAPWLGLRAGIFLSSVGSGGKSSEAAISKLLTLVEQGLLGTTPSSGSFPFAAHSVEGAIVLDTRDVAKARSFLQALAKRAGAHTSSYRGTSYQVADGIAFGVVARLAVIGTEPALRSVIDTTSGGGLSLAHSPSYAKLQAAAPAGTLAHVYANPGAVSETTGGKASAQGASSLLSLLGGQRLLNVSLVPSSTSFALDVDAVAPDSGTASAGLLSASPQASQALGELPGESWLAVGLGNVGSALGANANALQGIGSLGSLLTGTSSAPAAGLSVPGLLEGLLKPLSVLGAGTAETKRDFTSWMGSAGLFASGTGLLELKGGVVIDSKDPIGSRAAVAKLGAKLREGGGSVQRVSIRGTEAALAAHLSGLPVVLDIADGRDSSGAAKFVIGIGEQSVEAALNPSSTLSGAASYGTAGAALGQGIQPSVLVEFPTLLGLLEGVGLSEDPTVAPLVPYLRSLATLSGGGTKLGNGVERFRLVVGLQGSS
ncbi:MAG TPA: DUF3352 domain-containing protein [Solirubrobacteraceae bacterium]